MQCVFCIIDETEETRAAQQIVDGHVLCQQHFDEFTPEKIKIILQQQGKIQKAVMMERIRSWKRVQEALIYALEQLRFSEFGGKPLTKKGLSKDLLEGRGQAVSEIVEEICFYFERNDANFNEAEFEGKIGEALAQFEADMLNLRARQLREAGAIE